MKENHMTQWVVVQGQCNGSVISLRVAITCKDPRHFSKPTPLFPRRPWTCVESPKPYRELVRLAPQKPLFTTDMFHFMMLSFFARHEQKRKQIAPLCCGAEKTEKGGTQKAEFRTQDAERRQVCVGAVRGASVFGTAGILRLWDPWVTAFTFYIHWVPIPCCVELFVFIDL